MSTDIKFYVMHDKNTGDVEFVGSGNRLRMQDLMLRGYANIGSGLCRDVSELNRGICSNMRGMYEYQNRQNNELKIQLERALQKLKEVHRISDTTPKRRIREPHLPYGDETGNKLLSVQIMGEFPGFPCRPPARMDKELEKQFKEFWEAVN